MSELYSPNSQTSNRPFSPFQYSVGVVYTGVYSHPLHCWQYVTCGAPYGGDKELTCYSGRRFVPLTFECLPDKTCIYGKY